MTPSPARMFAVRPSATKWRCYAAWLRRLDQRKVARRNAIQVAWNIPVLAFPFIREAAVHARVV